MSPKSLIESKTSGNAHDGADEKGASAREPWLLHEDASPTDDLRSAWSRKYIAGLNGTGPQKCFIGDEDRSASNPGEKLVAYPSGQARQSLLSANSDKDPGYSTDYQSTTASPAEEMHGDAITISDFTGQSVSELPLTRGQLIWISSRHRQGWLLARNPRTDKSGLVPEKFVQLLRDVIDAWKALDAGHSIEERDLSFRAVMTHGSVATSIQPERESHSHLENRCNASNGSESQPIGALTAVSPSLLLWWSETDPPTILPSSGDSGYASLNTSPTLRKAFRNLHSIEDHFG